MVKKIVLSLGLLFVVGSICVGLDPQVTPEIGRDANGVPASVIHGKSSGEWVPVKVSADGTVQTSGSLCAGTTVTIDSIQMPLLQRTTVHLDAPITIASVDVTGSTVSVNDTRYINKTSSGTAGKITSATTATITVADRVDSWSFLYNDSTPGRYINVQPSIYGVDVPMKDGDVYEKSLSIPTPITFTITGLLASTTLQYEITTIK